MAVKGIVHIFRIALLNEDICNLVPSRMPCPYAGCLHFIKSNVNPTFIQLFQNCLNILLLSFIKISKDVLKFTRVHTIREKADDVNLRCLSVPRRDWIGC